MADVLTVCAALMVLVGFSFLFWFIRRLGILEIEAATMRDNFQRPKPEPQAMLEVKNPFTMSVSSTQHLGCIELIVSCLRPCHISCYWNVKKQSLDQIVYESNHSEEEDGEANEHNARKLQAMMEENCQTIVANYFTDICSEKQLSYNVEDLYTRTSSAKADTSNNEFYDIVVTMEMTGEDRETTELPSHITAMLTAVILKRHNEVFKAQLVQQFIQTRNGNLFKLKKLFLEEETNEEESASTQEEGNNMCIVCQMLPISRALIPCGHACLCLLCFDKMNTCPICRQPMTSSFVLREEPNLNENNEYAFSEILKRMNPVEIIKGIYSAS